MLKSAAKDQKIKDVKPQAAGIGRETVAPVLFTYEQLEQQLKELIILSAPVQDQERMMAARVQEQRMMAARLQLVTQVLAPAPYSTIAPEKLKKELKVNVIRQILAPHPSLWEEAGDAEWLKKQSSEPQIGQTKQQVMQTANGYGEIPFKRSASCLKF